MFGGELEVSLRKLMGNLADRTFNLLLASNTAMMLGLNLTGMVPLFLFLDFITYVVLRAFFGRTVGDVMFGIVIEAGFPKFGRLLLRWTLGYLSPLSGFLLHVPAVRWKSFCDSFSGINARVLFPVSRTQR